MSRATLISVLAAATALAHGTPPQTLGAAPNPWSPGGLIVPTTFGLLISADRCTWQWICTGHVGTGEREQPAWHVTSAGTIFAAALSGLYVSRDQGCTFERHAFFDGTGAAQVVSRGAEVFVVTGKYGAANGLARSSDDGRSFSWTTARATDAFFSGVSLAPSRPQRLYASSWYFDPPHARLWVSDDDGATFQSIDVAVPTAGSVLRVHGVDATDPDRLFLSAGDTTKLPERSQVLRSLDRGRTFTTVLEADGQASSVVQAGGHWFAAIGDRLYDSADGVTFAALESPKQRACVAVAGSEVLACGRAGFDPFVLVRVNGSELVPVLTWSQIAGPVTCGASTPAATTCATAWPVEKAELGLTPEHEAACSVPAPAPKPGCCQTSIGEATVCLLFFLRRRRRVESDANR